MTALLKNELDPDSQDSDRRTPLSYTAMNGHEAVARMLLATGQVNHSSEYSLGADSTLLGDKGWTRGGGPAAAP